METIRTPEEENELIEQVCAEIALEGLRDRLFLESIETEDTNGQS